MINPQSIHEIVGTLPPGITFITTHGEITLVVVRESACGGRRIDQYPLGCVVRLADVHRLLDWLGVLSPRAAEIIGDYDYQCEVLAQMVRNICSLPHAGPNNRRAA